MNNLTRDKTTYYKVLNEDGSPRHGGSSAVRWSLPAADAPGDWMAFDQIVEDALLDIEVCRAANGKLSAFTAALEDAIPRLVAARAARNMRMFEQFLGDPEFRALVERQLGNDVYRRVNNIKRGTP